MPQPGPETPDPRQQHPDREHGEQEPATEARHVGDRLAQLEGVDLLDVGRGELRPVPDDDLALADGDVDRRDVGRGLGLRGIGEVGAERRVRDDQRADQFCGEHPLRVAQIPRHQAGQLAASDGRPPNRAAGVRSVASRIRAASVLTSAHRAAFRPTSVSRGRRRQVRYGVLQQRCSTLVAEVGRERRVDRRDPRLEGDLLVGRDPDRVVRRERVLRRDGVLRRETCRIGLGLADEVDRARRHDVARRQLADRRVERLPRAGCPRRGWRSGPGSGSRPRSRGAGCPGARNGRNLGSGSGGSAWPGHWCSGLSASRRRGRRGRPRPAPGRRAR